MPAKVRICIVHPMDPCGGRIGGVGTYLRGLVKHAPESFAIEWVGVTSDPGSRPAKVWQEVIVEQREIRLFAVQSVRGENALPRIPLSASFAMSLYACRKRLGIGDAHLMFHRLEPALLFTHHRNRKVLFVHGNMKDLANPLTEVRWRHFPGVYFYLERRLFPGIDKIYAVRQDAVTAYQKRFPDLADRFAFIPTWVDEELFYPVPRDHEWSAARAAQNFGVDDRVMLSVGRLEGQKDPTLLLDTYEWVHKRDARVKLAIVGSGSLREHLEAEVRYRNLGNRISFYGSLPQGQVAKLLRLCDVFVLTSAFEGMPTTVLEALASGAPVVTTLVGEVNRVVRSGVSGEIVEERRPDALGSAVLSVLGNRDRYSVQGCVSSIEPFRAKGVLKQVYDTYLEFEALK